MELLGDVGQVEAHFSPFGDSFSLSTRYVHGLGLLGDVGQMEARFGLF
jgi:hypothetical protein